MSRKATSKGELRNIAFTQPEMLEDRLLLSLLGVGNEIAPPDVYYDATGTLAYTAATHLYGATAAPTSFVLSTGARPVTVVSTPGNPMAFTLNFQVDGSGNVIGGVPGDDLVIKGAVDTNRDGVYEYQGTLLTGEIVAFGYLDAGTNTDQYDFRLMPTGGSLMSFFAGKDIGMTMTSLNSTFIGSFAGDFGGTSQGVVGVIAKASLSGNVYVDANNNGQMDAGEAAIAGTTVILAGTDSAGNAVTRSLVTDAGGVYSFSDLAAGTYSISETQPGAYLDGNESPGNLGGTAGNDIFTVTIVKGATGTGYNFGELMPANLSGAVLSDALEIAGVTVQLSGQDDRGGQVSTTTTTAADGSYSFGGLRPGSYTISETQPAGWLDGDETVGSLGGTASNDAFAIAVAAGANGSGYNFGEIAPATLAGSVLAGSTPIAGVTITLAGTDDRGGSVSAVATTAANGSFSFGGLRPSSYTISETQPAGWLDGDETVGSLGGTVGNDIFTLGLAGGQNGSGYNFGEIAPATLAGSVLAGSTPIAGATITLAGTDDRGGSVSAVATTAANGSFSFGGLRPGGYTISETQPAGWLDGDETVGSLGGTASNDAFAVTVAPAPMARAITSARSLRPASPARSFQAQHPLLV